MVNGHLVTLCQHYIIGSPALSIYWVFLKDSLNESQGESFDIIVSTSVLKEKFRWARGGRLIETYICSAMTQPRDGVYKMKRNSKIRCLCRYFPFKPFLVKLKLYLFIVFYELVVIWSGQQVLWLKPPFWPSLCNLKYLMKDYSLEKSLRYPPPRYCATVLCYITLIWQIFSNRLSNYTFKL